ncbi:MAG: [Fe-Fe] hydrogenase large subunit C-terminal domain-containing protein [Candidatus Pacearchaeota archaeon]
MAPIKRIIRKQKELEIKVKNKNNILQIEKILKSKTPAVALLAPSFIVEFSYPNIIYRLKKLGFDKVVELTFGAKMINREYHKSLKNSKSLIIASPCPGIVNIVKNNFPELKNNLAQIDSPLTSMAKICRKHFPKHKTIFISPCDFKKLESNQSKYVDGVIDYDQLKELFKKYKIKKPLFKKKVKFDKFYNDYTKIYPISGGLGKTANLKGIIKEEEVAVIDGLEEVMKFLKNPDKKIRFLDCLFCSGGCINGPHTNKKLSVKKKRKIILKYLKKSKKEDIPEDRKGLIKKAKGIDFTRKV